jgi:hypothetical protein
MFLRLLFAVFLAGDIHLLASEFPAIYLVEGHISLQHYYNPNSVELSSKREGTITFVQSNGWWEVEIAYQNPRTNSVTVENCKKIPDGTRSYSLVSAGRPLMTVATASPVSFPTTSEMFASWLSFSSKPELPFLDDKRMRRILDLPEDRRELINSSQNEGNYAIRYLESDKSFVSSLQITNNGIRLDLEVTDKGIENRVTDMGTRFVEYTHEVLATTHIAGRTFPSHVIARRYGPLWKKETKGYTRTLWMQAEITLSQVELGPNSLRNRKPLRRLIANDARPINASPERTVNYYVEDDAWKSVNDPEIMRRAKELKQPELP